MSKEESLIDKHLRKISYNDYNFEGETDRKITVSHIILTVLTQIDSAIKSISKPTDHCPPETKPIGSSASWFLLQNTLRALAEGVNTDPEEDEKIDLNQYQSLFNEITNHLRPVR